MKSVILIGATGATGSKILPLLLNEERVNRVTAFIRRPIIEHEKLVQVVVKDFDKLEEATSSKQWMGDVIVNAIGTTRALARSGEEFVKVERDYSQKAMSLAKTAGQAKKSITISAQTANPDIPAPHWLQPLLYTKTLGEKEEAALSQNFKHNTIFRPGVLDREAPDTGGYMSFITDLVPGKLPVSVLARAVLHEVVKEEPDSETEITVVSGNSRINEHAQKYKPEAKA